MGLAGQGLTIFLMFRKPTDASAKRYIMDFVVGLDLSFLIQLLNHS